MAPRIVGNYAASQVRSVPARRVIGACQRGKTLAGIRVSPEVEIIQVERARKTFDLDLGGLGLGLAEIAEHPRSDQRHDQSDDSDDHQDFDQREAGLRLPAAASCRTQNVSTHFHLSRTPSHLRLFLSQNRSPLFPTPPY